MLRVESLMLNSFEVVSGNRISQYLNPAFRVAMTQQSSLIEFEHVH